MCSADLGAAGSNAQTGVCVRDWPAGSMSRVRVWRWHPDTWVQSVLPHGDGAVSLATGPASAKAWAWCQGRPRNAVSSSAASSQAVPAGRDLTRLLDEFPVVPVTMCES